MAAIIVPLAIALIPEIPQLVTSISNMVKAIRDDPQTPAQAKAQLDAIATRLDQTAEEVKAVEIRQV